MSIEAMKQALEALENSRVFVTTREKIKHPEGTEWYDERITALRQAIEQAEKQEPYGYLWFTHHMERRFTQYKPKEEQRIGDVRPVYAAPVDAVNISQECVDEAAKGEHEPVAYKEECWACGGEECVCAKRASAYFSPPKREWVGLTDDEFKDIYSKYALQTTVGLMYFKDEIEAKLKEKNGG